MPTTPEERPSTGCAFPLILLAIHAIGAASLGLFGYGVAGCLGFPVFMIFGWPFLIPEAIALAMLWKAYEPDDRLRFRQGLLGSIACGACMMAIIGIGEIGSEVRWRVINALAGGVTGGAAFLLVHHAKLAAIRAARQEELEEEDAPNA